MSPQADSPALFHILPPQRIPTRSALRTQVDAPWFTEVAAFASSARSYCHSEAIDKLNVLRECLPAPAPTLARQQQNIGALGLPLLADDAGHDQYFQITRVSGSEGPAFLRSMVSAALLFHAEMQCTYAQADQARFAAVAAGLASLLGAIAGTRLPPIEHERGGACLESTSVNPMYRWRLGHQIFAALTQGLIFSLLVFETATREGNAEQAREALRLTADLYLASASAFRFAADFAAEAYRDLVRPSMMPPHVSDGFSGLLSIDHRYLVAVLTRLRPLMSAASVRFVPEHRRLTDALNHVYADHKLVCSQFVGAERPSLRCPRAATHLSGVEQLERYQHARVGLLQPGSGSEPVILD